MNRGIFITIEGPDGCGKSTQAKLAVEFLRKRGFPIVHTREPGGTRFAEKIRKIILDPELKILPLAELLLYEASRAQHTDEMIRPSLKQGKIVFCERYTDATLAYQGHGRKLDLKLIGQLNRIATSGLVPDLTVLLDVPAEVGLKRAQKLNKKDRLEQAGVRFHTLVRQGYLKIAKKEPRRIKLISGTGKVETIHQRICSELLKVV